MNPAKPERQASLTLANLFDQSAQHYDQARRQLVPCFDDLYGTALQLLPAQRELPLRILDIGAGTGLLSALILALYPEAQITLVDIAADMLRKAAERLHEHTHRVDIRVMDMSLLDIEETYDLVVSALAIHHLEDMQKRDLFKKIYALLVEGGRFVHIEQVLGGTPEIEQVYEQVWLQTVHAKGVSADNLSAALERMTLDKATPLNVQLHWLEETGFRNVNCWYQWYRFAVYSGDKSPTGLASL